MSTKDGKIEVRISYDEMVAYLKLDPIPVVESYSKEAIYEELVKAGVLQGVDEGKIDCIIRNGMYGREIAVAKGDCVVHGIDGYFDFMFNTKTDTAPVIRLDGTVDYWSSNAIEVVHKGQLIAKYVPPIQGHDGYTIKGKEIKARIGKDSPPLKGTGFEVGEDGVSYYATEDGKIEWKNKRIVISPIYEVFSDVGIRTGNIKFDGDVVVHGNVRSGLTIESGGSVTIDGTVEASTIIAQKDVVLRGGFKGGNRGYIKSKGNVVAKFIEFAEIEAEGYISATSLLNCDIISYDSIFLNGRLAHVVGGTIYGAGGVFAYSFGSDLEIKTKILAGVHEQLIKEIVNLKTLIEEDESLIQKIENGLKEFEERHNGTKVDDKQDEARVSLFRAKVAKQAELSEKLNELNRLNNIVAKSKKATVKASQDIYPGVEVSINNIKVQVREAQSAVEFVEKSGRVRMYSLAKALVV